MFAVLSAWNDLQNTCKLRCLISLHHFKGYVKAAEGESARTTVLGALECVSEWDAFALLCPFSGCFYETILLARSLLKKEILYLSETNLVK